MESVTVVRSATDSHNRKHLNRSTAESVVDLLPLQQRAALDGIRTRVSISMVFGCPFEGDPGLDPTPGEHNREVLKDIGLSEKQIAKNLMVRTVSLAMSALNADGQGRKVRQSLGPGL